MRSPSSRAIRRGALGRRYRVGSDDQDLENSDLTYEKKHELNIGADLGFLDNRINLTVDWYKRDNFDLIGLVMTQGIGGQIQKYGNVATMKSGYRVLAFDEEHQDEGFQLDHRFHLFAHEE